MPNHGSAMTGTVFTVLPPGGEIGKARMMDTSGNCWREGPRFDLPNPKGVRNCPKGEVLKEGISTQN